LQAAELEHTPALQHGKPLGSATDRVYAPRRLRTNLAALNRVQQAGMSFEHPATAPTASPTARSDRPETPRNIRRSARKPVHGKRLEARAELGDLALTRCPPRALAHAENEVDGNSYTYALAWMRQWW
jgi:hypothetical protein